MAAATYIAASAGVVIGVMCFLFSIALCRCFRRQKPQDSVDARKTRAENSESGALKLIPQQSMNNHPVDSDAREKRNSSVHPQAIFPNALFCWDDHPSLVNDAVENGWAEFAFTEFVTSTPSPRSKLLGLCSTGDNEKEMGPEISWEVCPGSSDFMQKIKLNSGIKKEKNDHITSVIRAALPLPGPPLASFPQEAYFEITVLSMDLDDGESAGTVKESEKTNLFQENYNQRASSESSLLIRTSNKANGIEELKLNGGEEEQREDLMFSIGLSSGGSSPLRFPGSYPGSIGFNSNGSVFLDGIKLVTESPVEGWGKKDKVIGCGFDPSQKKVFFTVDSKLFSMINCKSEEFASPLYPTLAANTEISVLVNLGQSLFRYESAQRTTNPCFVGPLVNTSGAPSSYEDSGELFSMALDSQWLNPHSRASQSLGIDTRVGELEKSGEVGLFEIVVEESHPNKASAS